MSWIVKSFGELTNIELYNILKLRVDIFVVEQNCAYPEIDGKDIECLHLMKKDGEEIVAYTRLLPPGVSYEQASIGRVIVNPHYRKQKVGKELLAKSIELVQEKFKTNIIKIQAQSYLLSFYSSFGFVAISEEYLEDEIPHVDMILEVL